MNTIQKYQAIRNFLEIVANGDHPLQKEYAEMISVESLAFFFEYKKICEDHGMLLVIKEAN